MINRQSIYPKNKIWHGGQAVLIAVIFFMIISVTVIFGFAVPILKQVKISSDLLKSRQTFFLAEAGLEDVAYRMKSQEYTVDSGENIVVLGDYEAFVDVEIIPQGRKLTSTGDFESRIRKIEARLILAEGTAFNYGVQVGDGGLIMDNLAKVIGNVYSNGNISAANNSEITGTAIVATPNGMNNGKVSENLFAHSCSGGANITGTLYLYSDDTSPNCNYDNLETPYDPFGPQDLPISDEEIDDWKNLAFELGGICGEPLCDDSGNYIQDIGTSGSLGPIKITGDLIVRNNAELELTGTLWVEGDVIIRNGARVFLSAEVYGTESGKIISDSEVFLENGSTSEGSGVESESGEDVSYIMYVSTSNSSGAIEVEPGNTSSTIVYSNNGTVIINNTADLLEVVGYAVTLRPNAQISYELGLANTTFITGPGGTFQIFNWREIE